MPACIGTQALISYPQFSIFLGWAHAFSTFIPLLVACICYSEISIELISYSGICSPLPGPLSNLIRGIYALLIVHYDHVKRWRDTWFWAKKALRSVYVRLPSFYVPTIDRVGFGIRDHTRYVIYSPCSVFDVSVLIVFAHEVSFFSRLFAWNASLLIG
jgi:hypothetical protein